MITQRRISTATLIIGVSGSGKTSLLETFAVYLWETYQKVLLLYSWDGGAIPTNLQKRMHQGLVRFWRARTRSSPTLALETLYMATKGYWPRQIDPATGEVSPAVDLVAPITTKYALTCPKGHPLRTVPTRSLIVPTLCTHCGNQMIAVADIRADETVTRTKGFEQVGGVAYDGLTSMTGVVMNEMDFLRGHGHIGGEKSAFGGVVTSGSTKFGGNNRADVGFSQTRAEQFVTNTLSIPFLVEAPVFTGLSTQGTDKGGLTVVGVDLPGQAALTQAPQWFGNICEADQIIDADGKKHFSLNLVPFTDTDGRRHLLKTSASPGGVPERLVDPPVDAGAPFTEFNLGRVFKLLDEDLKQALTEELAGAPGLPTGVVEYGEAARIEEPGPGLQAPAAPTPVAPVVAATAPTMGRPTVGAPTPTAPRAARPTITGTASPPPPGMKPPQRAPGT